MDIEKYTPSSYDKRDILIVSLLEYICSIINSNMFLTMCNYLYSVGLITNSRAFSDDTSYIRDVHKKHIQCIVDKNSCKMLDNVQKDKTRYEQEFIELEPLGDGGFGYVYKCYNKVDQNTYAVKKIPIVDDIDYMREASYLAQLNNSNIVRYFSSWITVEDITSTDMYEDTDIVPVLYIQMELCDTTLRDYTVKKNYNGGLDTSEINSIIIKILDGLKYLHSKNILHRDINPNNILIKNNTPKISDFGLAKRVEENSYISSCKDGQLLYRPPEVDDGIYTEKSDLYSVAVVYFELLYRFTTEFERVEVLTEIRKGNFPKKFTEEYSEHCKIIKKMLSHNINDRLDTDSFINEITNC